MNIFPPFTYCIGIVYAYLYNFFIFYIFEVCYAWGFHNTIIFEEWSAEPL